MRHPYALFKNNYCYNVMITQVVLCLLLFSQTCYILISMHCVTSG